MFVDWFRLVWVRPRKRGSVARLARIGRPAEKGAATRCERGPAFVDESVFGVVLVDPAAALWAMERPALEAVRRVSCLDVRRKKFRKRGFERVKRGGERAREEAKGVGALSAPRRTRRRGRNT